VNRETGERHPGAFQLSYRSENTTETNLCIDNATGAMGATCTGIPWASLSEATLATYLGLDATDQANTQAFLALFNDTNPVAAYPTLSDNGNFPDRIE